MKKNRSPDRPRIQVAAALIVEGRSVLIARRPPGARHAGWWEFPGGKQELGESLEECLIREIEEELEVIVEHLRYFMKIDHDYGDFSLTLHAFLCQVPDSRLLPAGDDLAWVSLDEQDRFPLLPPDRQLMTVLKNTSIQAPDYSKHSLTTG